MELQVLQRVIAHIEEHLREDKPYLLDNAALAKVAGLSVFHFLREFRAAAGLSAADYIRKRRISEIVKRMGEERPMSDIAFEYGFNSKEHFTRAFEKEHVHNVLGGQRLKVELVGGVVVGGHGLRVAVDDDGLKAQLL